MFLKMVDGIMVVKLGDFGLSREAIAFDRTSTSISSDSDVPLSAGIY
jgi:hypothetical protein